MTKVRDQSGTCRTMSIKAGVLPARSCLTRKTACGQRAMRDLDSDDDQSTVVLAFALLAAVAGGCYLVWRFFHTGELGAKPYYAALQVVEYENRPNKIAEPLLRTNIDGLGTDAIGVPGRDRARTRVWIILNETDSDGHPYLMPQGVEINRDCAQIERVLHGRPVSTAVQQLLEEGCGQH